MCLYYRVFQSTPVKDAAVSLIVLLVRDIQARGINVKGIRILHGELAHANQSGLGTRLIAKLVLNLIPDLRQLLVAAQLFSGNLSHDLFMSHAQAEIASAPVFQAEHVVAHAGPASAGLP